MVFEGSFVAEGEQVSAVQYRKVQFKWYLSRDLDRAALEKGSRWKVHSSLRGQEIGTNDVVEAIISSDKDPDGEEIVSPNSHIDCFLTDFNENVNSLSLISFPYQDEYVVADVLNVILLDWMYILLDELLVRQPWGLVIGGACMPLPPGCNHEEDLDLHSEVLDGEFEALYDVKRMSHWRHSEYLSGAAMRLAVRTRALGHSGPIFGQSSNWC